MPFRRSVRLPRTKTRGRALNLASGGENIQKHIEAAARSKYSDARPGWYSRSPAKFSKKNSRRVTAAVYLKTGAQRISEKKVLPNFNLHEFEIGVILELSKSMYATFY